MSEDDCVKTYIPFQIVQENDKFENQKFWIENGIDLENRRIDLDEDIDYSSVGYVIRGIRSMIKADIGEPIDIYINSFGGSVYDGLRLYDVVKGATHTPIRVHAEGKIMSMGLIIYLAGDPEDRYASPNATFMAHSLSSGVWGKMYEMDIDVKECKRLNERLIAILVENTNKSSRWWKAQIRYEDRYYDKEKAIKLGIVTNDDFEVD